MSTRDFKLEITGLKELKDSFNQIKVDKEIALGIGAFTRKLHSELRFGVVKVYDLGKSPKSLNSVLLGNSTSTRKLGSNVIEGGLVYKHIPIGLGKFPFEWYWGNINPARKKGRVHEVRVKRGRSKIVYGREHRGGFVPIAGDKNGYKRTLFRGQLNMYERKTQAHEPLRLLFGPSLAMMASKVFDTDRNIQNSLNSIEEYISKSIKL